MSDDSQIIILAGLQRDGTTYQLHPIARKRLKERYPGVSQAPTVFVGYDTQNDFERLHGPMWAQIATLLTGLSETALRDHGRVVVRVPCTAQELTVAL